MNRFIVSAAAVIAAVTASSETLTPAQALARVNNMATEATAPGARRMAARALASATPARIVTNHSSEAELYVFTPADGGMMLVSAESETPALIGYSDQYIAGAEMPPALQMMIDNYAAEIAAMRAGDVIYGAAAQSRAEGSDDMPEIAPLCSTRWNQDAPYNQRCPTVGGYRSVTGCVATAMAQVLKVYEYPAKCSGGTYSYVWNNSYLTLNYDDVTLDWDAMTDTYNSSSSAESKAAVAELMRAVGYSANMNYSPEASGASSLDLQVGLVRNFGFDCTLGYYYREWFPLAQWQKMIYDVLAEGYPVYYDGVTADNQAGHAFVVDGYRGDNFFHLNWGWGGVSDGYFLLTALDPAIQGIGGASAGFDRSQGAILGLKKGQTTSSADAPYRFYSLGGFRTSVTSAKLGSAVSFKYTVNDAAYNASPNTATKVHSAVKMTKADGTVYNFYSSTAYNNIATAYGIYSPMVTMSAALTDGKYTITPAVYNPSNKTFYDVYYPIGVGGSIEAEVADGTITFNSSASRAALTATDVTIPATIYAKRAFNLSCTITNNGAEEYYGPVTVCLYEPGKFVKKAELSTFIAGVDAGETHTYNSTQLLSITTIPSGTYDLVLLNQNNIRISEPVTANIVTPDSSGKLKASGLTCTNNASNELTFTLKLTASDGNFKGPVRICINNRGDYTTSHVCVLESEELTIANGASQSVTISGDFSNGTVGENYTAYVYYDYEGEANEASGRQRCNFTLAEQSSINEVGAAAADTGAEFFDLSGRKVANPAQKGIYIMRSGNKTTKIRI